LDAVDGDEGAYADRPGWDDDPGLVRAAGGVVWRRQGDDIEILLVHRPRYDDWSLPKGKLEPGESHLDSARREVAEETGFEVEVGRELRSTRYVDHKGRKKTVRYWEMAMVGGRFGANDETDELRWLAVADARRLATYAHDADIVDSFAEGRPLP
jgi:8-oxo-dGTP pyrophosphatase MutT (NUDIX family)